ncbi:hypothetical protein LIS90_13395 [Flavobacterium psychrophilum]|uniref:hypothetical protein n=1 Tax=Flavobacterium psychrophilum TaxID=96345 RepID=UPI00106D8C08|nr:hypothetical protein [Flavobacterium psychrophilum]MCB6089655.1 hypothetical protein [Flavobacterium psychrophilum]MCB6232241.1 hypothetical protein [Flavobacterium psychrophilum]
MKANELRVGNYFIGYSNYLQQWELASFKLLAEGIEVDEIIRSYIPLDEEWFLKCKSNSIFNNGFKYKKTSTERFEIYVGMSLIAVIEFVHELQNLNFALLGEDAVFENV